GAAAACAVAAVRHRPRLGLIWHGTARCALSVKDFSADDDRNKVSSLEHVRCIGTHGFYWTGRKSQNEKKRWFVVCHFDGDRTHSGSDGDGCAMSHKQIYYSDKYDDEKYEYRHVMLPKDIAKRVPKTHLMSETEWRNLGVQQSQGWVHYMIHQPEPHILLFRRPLPSQKA
uniref:Cyclin-dependent kinases regulatory subunit n=4 Tax=Cottioidei TaxID=8100 RepID=A0AAQ4Q683_GASAC